MADESLEAILHRTAFMVAQLAETALHHSERLDRLDGLMTEQVAINTRLGTISTLLEATLFRLEHTLDQVDTRLARLDVRLDAIATLLARLIPPGDNGRDA